MKAPKPIRIFLVEPYRVGAYWSDGQYRITDFEPLLRESSACFSGSSIYQDLLDKPDLFCTVQANKHTFYWKDLAEMETLEGVVSPADFELAPEACLAASQVVSASEYDVSLQTQVEMALLKQGLSRSELAVALGTTPSGLSMILTGSREPTLNQLRLMVHLLDIPADVALAPFRKVLSVAPKRVKAPDGTWQVWPGKIAPGARVYNPDDEASDLLMVADQDVKYNAKPKRKKKG